MKNDEATYAAKEAAFRNRVKRARKEAGFTQKRMAAWLGVEMDAYKKYENRDGSTMPFRYHEDFCELTQTRLEWFTTGKGQRAIEKPVPAAPEAAPVRKPLKKPRKKAGAG